MMSLKEKPKPCSLTPSATRPAMSFKRRRVNLIGEHTDYNDGFVLPALSTTRR